MSTTVRFTRPSQDGYHRTVTKRVNEYFKTAQISKTANTQMYVKTLVMLLLYFGPYALILSGVTSANWILLLLSVVMGWGLAGIGLSIMHDANHGSYFKSDKLNYIRGLQSEGKKVMMIGDGLNDAGALQQADVDAELYVVKDGDHARGGEFGSPELHRKTVTFLQQHLQ